MEKARTFPLRDGYTMTISAKSMTLIKETEAVEDRRNYALGMIAMDAIAETELGLKKTLTGEALLKEFIREVGRFQGNPSKAETAKFNRLNSLPLEWFMPA